MIIDDAHLAGAVLLGMIFLGSLIAAVQGDSGAGYENNEGTHRPIRWKEAAKVWVLWVSLIAVIVFLLRVFL